MGQRDDVLRGTIKSCKSKKKIIEQLIYVTEKGVEVPIHEMTHEHLVNAFAKSSTLYNKDHIYYITLKAEVLRRLRLKADGERKVPINKE